MAPVPSMRLALAAVLGAGLGGCASAPTPPPAGVASGAVLGAAAPVPAGLGDETVSPYGLFLAGETARDEGSLGAAAELLTRAAAAEGDPPFLTADAFTAALQAGNVAQAAELAPDSPSTPGWRLGVVVRGVEALADRKDREAYALLATTSLPYPERVAADLLAPFAAAGAGDAVNALARATFEGDPSNQFVADLDRAELLERFGRLAEAEAAYKSLVGAGDVNAMASQAYAAFLVRRGRPRETEALSGPAQAPERPRARPRLPSLQDEAAAALLVPAASLVQQHDEGLALAYLRLSLRLDPASDPAWEMIGDLLARADPEAARAAYARVAPGATRFVAARDKLAWLDQRAGDHDEALKIARAAAALAPGDREAQSNLAVLLSDDDRYAEAAAVLTGLIETAGAKPDWRLYYLRASAYDAMGDWPKTEADLGAALALAPDEPELLNFQGYYWIDRGRRLKESLAMVERAAAAEPRSGEIVDSLGWAYYRLGDYPQAVASLERAVGLQPGAPEINDHLADAYWRVGRRLEAEFQWRRVLTLDPTAALKARVDAKLASPLGPDASAAAQPPGSAATPASTSR